MAGWLDALSDFSSKTARRRHKAKKALARYK